MLITIKTTGRTSIWVENTEQAEILEDYIDAKETYDDDEIERLEKENPWLEKYFITDGAESLYEDLEYDGLQLEF